MDSFKFHLELDFDSDSLKPWIELLGPITGSAMHLSDPSRFGSRAEMWAHSLFSLASAIVRPLDVPLLVNFRIVSFKEEMPLTGKYSGICVCPGLALVPELLAAVFEASATLGTWAIKANINDSEDCLRFKNLASEKLSSVLNKLKSKDSLGPKVSTFQIIGAAIQKNIPSFALPGLTYQLGWGKNHRKILHSATDLDSALGRAIAGDKQKTSQWLRLAGLPVPDNVSVTTFESAQKAANEIGFPLVVKPIDADRGEGVSIDVTQQNLESAYNNALNSSPRKTILIERQIPGVVHRVWICRGSLLYVIRRLPVGFYADGLSTVGELFQVHRASQMQISLWDRTHVTELDTLALKTLANQGLVPSSTPPKGVFVALRPIETTEWGGTKDDLTKIIHPHNVRIAISAAKILGLESAGVDIISRDISVPWFENDAAINEVNFSPALAQNRISRSYLPTYLSRMIEGDGRIPIEVYVGGQSAFRAAQIRQVDLLASGTSAWVTSSSITLMPPHSSPNQIVSEEGLQGDINPMATDGLASRARALLMSHETEAMILVVQDDDIVETLVLIDRVESVLIVDDELRTPAAEGAEPLSNVRKEALLKKLANWTRFQE